MQRRLAVVISCLLLAAGLFLGWSHLSNLVYVQPPLPADPETYRAQEVEWRDVPIQTSERAKVVTAGAAAGEPEAYRKALSGIKGRLVWNAGRRPVAGVRVRIAEIWLDALAPNLEDLARLEATPSPVLFRAEATTDSEGYFVLAGIHSRAALLLAIGLKTDKAAVRLVDRSPAPGELVDLGDVVLMERGTVSGTVVDDDGKAVAGARVRVAGLPQMAWQLGAERFDPMGMMLVAQGTYRVVLALPPWAKDIDSMLPFGDAQTDATGRFVVRGVQPGTPTVIVTQPGRSPLTRSITVVSDQPTELGELILGEGNYLSGRFVDEEGTAVTGIEVAAGGVMSLAPAGFIGRPSRVDSKGRFELSGLPRLPLYLCYRRAIGEPWEVSGPHHGDDDLSIKLPTLRQGTIRVKAEDGRDLGDVEFGMSVADESAYMPGMEAQVLTKLHLKRDTREPGLWRVTDLPAKIYKVIARAPGYAITTGVLDLRTQSKSRSVEIVLPAAPTTRFEVSDERGNPIQAARIYWNAKQSRSESSKRKRLTGAPLAIGQTDAEGVLTTSAIEAGAKFLFCRHPAYAMAAVDKLPSGSTPTVRFVLGRTGELSGILAANGTGPEVSRTILAAPNRDLRRRFQGLLTPRFAPVLPDGSFHFPDLQPGTWKVRSMPPLGTAQTPLALFRLASDKSQQGARSTVEITAGQESFVQLEMKQDAAEGSGRLIGTVRNLGKPMIGAHVTSWGGRQRALVSDDGSFELKGLRDGNLWIGVELLDSAQAIERLWEGRVQIRDGSTETLHLDLQLTALTVRVTDTDGRPVPGVPLELRGMIVTADQHRGSSRLSGKTNASGELKLKNVPSGRHELRSGMQANPRWVIEPKIVEAFAETRVVDVTTQRPRPAQGSIIWDESELATEAERAFARSQRPKYLVLENDGRFRWGPIRHSAEGDKFSLESGAPGNYQIRSKSKLRWTSSTLVLPARRGETLRLRMRPDATQVRAAVKIKR